jgi:hypothetical protein
MNRDGKIATEKSSHRSPSCAYKEEKPESQQLGRRVMSDERIEQGILEFVKARQIAGLTLTEVHADHGVATVRGRAATTLAKRVCWECCRRVTGVRFVVDLVELSA